MGRWPKGLGCSIGGKEDGSPCIFELLLVGTWLRGSNVEFQQHQEALGACLATEAEIQEVDLDGSVLL